MAAKKVTITIDEEILKRLAPYRDRVNLSALASQAVIAELDRLDAEAREAAQRDALQWVETWYNYAPLAAAAQLERADREVSPPPEVYKEIIKRGSEYGPAYLETAFSQWNAGTNSVWQRIKGNES